MIENTTRGSAMKEATINLNGLNLFYLDTESGDKTILCFHGRWGRGKTWSGFMERYQDRYRIIAPDQRGHGLSDRPAAGYTADDLVDLRTVERVTGRHALWRKSQEE